MSIEGVDYSVDRPNLDVLWAAGIRFVCRYLAKLPNGKVLTGAELQALHRHGFGVVLNWEQAAGDMLRGYDLGRAHAAEALRQANALGAPTSVPIFFSCDVDTTTDAQRAAAGRYLDGAVSVLGRARVGVYGEFEVIETLTPIHATWGWQTYAWSGGRISGKAHFLQYRNGVALAGADLDRDRSLKDPFGAWWPTAIHEPVAREDDDMDVMIAQDGTGALYRVEGGISTPVKAADLPSVAQVIGQRGGAVAKPGPTADAREWTTVNGVPVRKGWSPEVFGPVPAATVALSPADLAAVTAALIAAPDVPLGADDMPAIEAALRRVLVTGTEGA